MPMTWRPQQSRGVRRGVDNVEQLDLVRVRAAASTRSLNPRGRLQAVHVALELGSGEPAATADVDRSQLAGLHEGVHGGAAETEDSRGLLGRQQQGIACQNVPKPLRLGLGMGRHTWRRRQRGPIGDSGASRIGSRRASAYRRGRPRQSPPWRLPHPKPIAGAARRSAPNQGDTSPRVVTPRFLHVTPGARCAAAHPHGKGRPRSGTIDWPGCGRTGAGCTPRGPR
jgi:hypothetical protein